MGPPIVVGAQCFDTLHRVAPDAAPGSADRWPAVPGRWKWEERAARGTVPVPMNIMMKRRLRAVLLLVVLCGPLAATLGSGATGPSCSMCSKVCCCAPRTGAGSCRLERPCGRDTDTQAPALRLTESLAILTAEEEPIPREESRSFRPAPPLLVLDLVRTPPDPPPRLSS